MNRPKTGRARLFKLEDDSIVQVHAMLFTGNALGGHALEALLDKYRCEGPMSSARSALIWHLHRCFKAMVEMDATIIARCHLDANRRHPKRVQRTIEGSKPLYPDHETKKRKPRKG